MHLHLIKEFLGPKYTTIKASCMSKKKPFSELQSLSNVTGLFYTQYKGHFCFPP